MVSVDRGAPQSVFPGGYPRFPEMRLSASFKLQLPLGFPFRQQRGDLKPMAATAPLARYRVLATSRLDEARDKVARYFWPHRIEFEGGRRSLSASFHHAPVAGSSLNFIRYGADTYIDAGEQPDCYMFKYAAFGPLEAIRERERHDVKPGQLIVSGPRSGLKVRFARATGLLIFKVPRPRLEQHLAAMLGDRPVGRVTFRDGAVEQNGAMASYVRALHFLRAELDTADSLARSPLAAIEYEEFLLSALLRAWPHDASEKLESPDEATPAHVRRVVDHIEAHAGQSLTATDLVTVAGIGTSALYEGFRRHRGMTPLAYLRAVRLARTHAEFAHPEPGATVTTVALKWGFSHFGRFSAYYREAYGETPSETLARGRQKA
jgi:AraC-like DNA-binding protein